MTFFRVPIGSSMMYFQRIQHQNSTFQPQLPLIEICIVSGQQYIKSGFLYSMRYSSGALNAGYPL